MVWTDITRAQYERNYGRYASDCSDEEWQLIEPFLPPEKYVGRPRTTNCAMCGMQSSIWHQPVVSGK